jgi:hypothetical protein
MKKEIDFSKGEQGRYAGMHFVVVGDSSKINNQRILAICLDNTNCALIKGKLYDVEIIDRVFSVIDENEKHILCSMDIFLTVSFEPKIATQLRELISA